MRMWWNGRHAAQYAIIFTMTIKSWTDEQFVEAVASSTTQKEVILKLGLKPSGGTYQHVKRHIARLNLDTSHFLGQSSNRGKIPRNRRTAEEILVLGLESDARVRAPVLRRSLEESGVKYVCSVTDCGNRGEWFGQPLTLQVDHVNGKHWDNRIENLRFLCPNCHTQTPNWGMTSSCRRMA
jgi:5-methylcytosine-specific restriction endonuclease McrA